MSLAKCALAALAFAAALSLPAAPAGGAAEARVYVWRDAQGVLRFTPVSAPPRR